MTVLELARLIRIVPEKGLEIDGEVFPWYIAERASVDVARGDLTKVTVSIVCERVEIDDQRRVLREMERDAT